MTERERAEKIIRERTIMELLETCERIHCYLPEWERAKLDKSIKTARHSLGLIEYTRK